MKPFSYFCAQVGYDPKDFNPPELDYTYYAYKSGEVKQFSTMMHAKAFSSNVEKVVSPASKQARDAYFDIRSKLENKAYELWMTELRNEFCKMKTKLFDVIYNKAYERGHASGYDEVANYVFEFAEFAEFAEEILKAA